jgi:hypothetical protein
MPIAEKDRLMLALLKALYGGRYMRSQQAQSAAGGAFNPAQIRDLLDRRSGASLKTSSEENPQGRRALAAPTSVVGERFSEYSESSSDYTETLAEYSESPSEPTAKPPEYSESPAEHTERPAESLET